MTNSLLSHWVQLTQTTNINSCELKIKINLSPWTVTELKCVGFFCCLVGWLVASEQVKVKWRMDDRWRYALIPVNRIWNSFKTSKFTYKLIIKFFFLFLALKTLSNKTARIIMRKNKSKEGQNTLVEWYNAKNKTSLLNNR